MIVNYTDKGFRHVAEGITVSQFINTYWPCVENAVIRVYNARTKQLVKGPLSSYVLRPEDRVLVTAKAVRDVTSRVKPMHLEKVCRSCADQQRIEAANALKAACESMSRAIDKAIKYL